MWERDRNVNFWNWINGNLRESWILSTTSILLPGASDCPAFISLLYVLFLHCVFSSPLSVCYILICIRCVFLPFPGVGLFLPLEHSHFPLHCSPLPCLRFSIITSWQWSLNLPVLTSLYLPRKEKHITWFILEMILQYVKIKGLGDINKVRNILRSGRCN